MPKSEIRKGSRTLMLFSSDRLCSAVYTFHHPKDKNNRCGRIRTFIDALKRPASRTRVLRSPGLGILTSWKTHRKLERKVGVEPTTFSLEKKCSTAELLSQTGSPLGFDTQILKM
jgi:hypothetical protein